MIENWVSLERTVDFIKTETGSSLGPACQTLISICESGEVRARWTDHYLRKLPAIHKRDWIGADIDWRNFRVVKADGAGMAGVDFSENDLHDWAKSQSAAPAAAETPLPTSEESCTALIVNWLKKAPGLTKTEASAKSRETIRDLQPKEFDRAWRRVPQELKNRPGRPSTRN